jgi:CRP/FNR family cyclic AMP-dependent transcriptional regulator
MVLFFDLFRNDPEFLSLKAGDYLFKEGSPSNERMYVLVEGLVEISVGDTLLEEANTGSIVGEMAVIDPQEPRSATVRAKTDCRFVEITPKRFNYLVAEAPNFAVDIMRVLIRRLRRTDQLLTA